MGAANAFLSEEEDDGTDKLDGKDAPVACTPFIQNLCCGVLLMFKLDGIVVRTCIVVLFQRRIPLLAYSSN